MTLNKRIMSVNLLIFALILFIVAINGNAGNKNEEVIMGSMKSLIKKQAFASYIEGNINILQIEIPDNLCSNISYNEEDEKINILEYLKDGMENPAIVDYYQEDINDVMMISHSKYIAIRYYETDLNDDGMNDLIVLISSPFHSGSHGDTFDILFNNKNYYRENEVGYIFRLISDSTDGYLPFGQVYILNSKTNGYHDLEIFTDETHFFLKYQNGAYQYISID